MKIESNARDLLLLVVGTQVVSGALIFGTLLITGAQRNAQNGAPRVEAVFPEGAVKVSADIRVPAAQVEVRQVPVDRVQVPDVKVQNNIQPATVQIQLPTKPVDINVVNLGLQAAPVTKTSEGDEFGSKLPEPAKR